LTPPGVLATTPTRQDRDVKVLNVDNHVASLQNKFGTVAT